MPRGDGTGPMGQGSRTGKGKGKCAVPRNATNKVGGGFGRGRMNNKNTQGNNTENEKLNGN